MKAPIAQAAAEPASALGCLFSFFWGDMGPRNRKMHLKKLGFRLGTTTKPL
jgi:hypothetical protein